MRSAPFRFVCVLAPAGLLGSLVVALALLATSLLQITTDSGLGRAGHLLIGALALGSTLFLAAALLGLRRELGTHREAEVALRTREARLLQFQEGMLEGFVVTDLEERITLVNSAACRMLGYDSEDLLGRSFVELTPPGQRELVRRATARRRRGESERYELRVRLPDGEERWLLVSGVPVRDDEGRVVEAAAVLRDITESKEAQQEVRKLARFPSENPNPILRVATDGTIVYANKASRALLEFWGIRSGQRLPGSMVSAVNLAFGHNHLEVREVSSHGTVFELIFAPIVSQGYVNIYGRDVTDARRAEREILDAQQRALEAARVKSEFLANMSHEIRTPLNGILGMTELLLESELDQEQRESLSMVLSSSRSLLRVVNDVLDFSRVEAGRLRLECLPFSLEVVVAEALKVVAARAGEKELELISDLDPSVPDSLEGDPERLRQVLLNLLDNAIKFTAEGAVAVSAALEETEDAPPRLLLTVADTGIGVSEEEQSRIFESFTQADGSTTRRYGGTGLGLTISSQLVALMGGHIEVESSPGHGSRFRLNLPLRTPREAVSETPAADEAASPASPSTIPATNGPRRVLLAEDNSINSRVVRRMLERGGYLVEVVSDGRRALEALEKARYHVAILDVEMPVMNGLEAAQSIRMREEREGGHLPILALTAHAMEGDRDRCLDAGMDEYLAKPVRARELVATVDLLCARDRDDADEAESLPIGDIVDRESLLVQVGGDRALLRELLDIFRKEAPARVLELRDCVAREDLAGLDRAAHRLQGTLQTLGGCEAGLAVRRFRDMARSGNLLEAERAISVVEREMARLTPVLEAVTREGGRS
jgi:PAS domain S-box-containing protein